MTEIVDPHVLKFLGLADPPPWLLQVRQVRVILGFDDRIGVAIDTLASRRRKREADSWSIRKGR